MQLQKGQIKHISFDSFSMQSLFLEATKNCFDNVDNFLQRLVQLIDVLSGAKNSTVEGGGMEQETATVTHSLSKDGHSDAANIICSAAQVRTTCGEKSQHFQVLQRMHTGKHSW